jgi:hypothetical protein
MAPITSIRRLLTRHRWAYWTLIIAIAVTVAALALEPGRRARMEQQRWGTLTPVLVVTESIDAGATIEAVEVRNYPVALIPENPLAPEARTRFPVSARHRLSAGAILTDTAITDARTPVAHARPGDVIAVIDAPSRLGLITGDRVMVATDGTIIIDDALVVDVIDESILISVEIRHAGVLTAAQSGLGGISVLLIP